MNSPDDEVATVSHDDHQKSFGYQLDAQLRRSLTTKFRARNKIFSSFLAN